MAVITRRIDFRPSVNGFHPPNALRGPNVTVSIPAYGKINIVQAYGYRVNDAELALDVYRPHRA